MSDRISLENRPEHLCATCKYAQKCKRTRAIHTALGDIESDALEKWQINVDVAYQINECSLYAVDWDLINGSDDEIVIEIYLDDEEDEDGNE